MSAKYSQLHHLWCSTEESLSLWMDTRENRWWFLSPPAFSKNKKKFPGAASIFIIFTKFSWPFYRNILSYEYLNMLHVRRTEPLLLNQTEHFILASCNLFKSILEFMKMKFHEKSNIWNKKLRKSRFCKRLCLNILHMQPLVSASSSPVFWSRDSVVFQQMCSSASYCITLIDYLLIDSSLVERNQEWDITVVTKQTFSIPQHE